MERITSNDRAKAGQPSRRTVLGAVVWSVPVIALAAPAPAAAASGDTGTEVQPGLLWHLMLRNDAGRQPVNGGIDRISVIVGLDPAYNPGGTFGLPVTLAFALSPAYYTGEWTGDGVTPASGSGSLGFSVETTTTISGPGNTATVNMNLSVLGDHDGTTLPADIVAVTATAGAAEPASLLI